jgi:hypothetical protein
VRDYLNPVDVDKFVEGTPGERFFQVDSGGHGPLQTGCSGLPGPLPGPLSSVACS